MKPFTDKEIKSITNWLDSQREFVFLETTRVTKENHKTFLFTKPKKWLICTTDTKAEHFLQEIESWRYRGFFLAGWIGYEFGYLLEPSLKKLLTEKDKPKKDHNLALLGVFEQPTIYSHKGGNSIGDLFGFINNCETDDVFSINNLRTNIDRFEYFNAIEKIKKYIKAGDTYQVNLTLKLLFTLVGSKAALYRSLRKNQSVSYSAWIRYGKEEIMSFSPELYFRSDNDTITVRPMKGTMDRGLTLEDDELHCQKLCRDPKNISENVMIVDLLRNDLARLMHTMGGGTVKPLSLFDVEIYETLLQMTSTIIGSPQKNEWIGLSEILKALFPCGSVTGAPKIRTMEIIHELEKEDRGVYCGAIGYSSREVTVFNVPIRTIVLNKNQGQMGIGSGIIYDSDPTSEWDECLLKGNFLKTSQTDFQIIETMLWQPDKGYRLLKHHLVRLKNSAEYFLFNYDLNEIASVLEQESQKFQESNKSFSVRLLLHRDADITVHSTQLDDTFNSDYTTPLRINPLPEVMISGQHMNSSDPFLYHKTTNRKKYDEERKKALEKGYYEVIFLNSNGEVTEGAISNVFILENKKLLTPPVSCGLLGGTLRSFLLEQGMVSEKKLFLKDLVNADEIYVGNSVRGLIQVRLNP